jgi:hypothetical protein
MLRTAVPEATVYEDRDPLSQKREICSASQTREGMVDSVAKPGAMQTRPKRKLGGCIALALAFHPTKRVR